MTAEADGRHKIRSKLSVAAFTGGEHVPSARFRVRQHIPRLNASGISVTEYCSYFGSYPPQSKLNRPLWGAASLSARIPGIAASYAHDVTLLQREFVSTLVTLESLTKRPRVLDIDDAIWANGREQMARKLAACCDHILCGNSYLADFFSSVTDNVTVLPTAVDTAVFIPGAGSENLVIGWSGSSTGFSHLYAIERAIGIAMLKCPALTLRVVAERPPNFKQLPADRVEFRRWSPQTEVADIQDLAIGIMPLSDSVVARGKCSFKLLTYMSCGVPVIASPIGMNVDVLAHDSVGLAPISADDWTDALLHLVNDREKRSGMGQRGREVVKLHYSADIIATKLAGFLEKRFL